MGDGLVNYLPRVHSVGLTPSTAHQKPAPEIPIVPGPDGSLPYRAFAARHPTYNADYWQRLRAFYRGGTELLNPAMLEKTLVRNNQEPDVVYAYRCANAFYLNYCSEIVDALISGLAGDQLRIMRDGKELDGEDPLAKWSRDVSPPQAERTIALSQFVQNLALEAFQVRQAWVLIDRPPADDADPEPANLLEAEERGLAKVWLRIVPAEQVLHWQVDDASGELQWALIGACDVRQDDFYGPPTIVETYTRYDGENLTQWRIAYPRHKPPNPEDPVQLHRKQVAHGFNRIPVRRFEITAGLWAMDKLEAPARAVFNKWNALDLAERRSLLPSLYEFLGPEMASKAMLISAAQASPSRATETPRSPYHVQKRGKDDRAMFVGPDAGPYKAALESIDKIIHEMHRVLYQLALAADNRSPAAVGRSGESKKEDRIATMVILAALGVLIRPFVESLIPDVLKGLGLESIEKADSYKADGLEKFDDVLESDLVEQTTMLVALSIPSPTAQREVFMRLLRRIFDHLDEETLSKISKEIESNITPESIAGSPEAQQAIIDAVQQAISQAVGGGAEDDEDPAAEEGEDDEPGAAPGAAPPKAKKPAGPMIDTAARSKKKR